jgi:hypothetical protein
MGGFGSAYAGGPVRVFEKGDLPDDLTGPPVGKKDLARPAFLVDLEFSALNDVSAVTMSPFFEQQLAGFEIDLIDSFTEVK